MVDCVAQFAGDGEEGWGGGGGHVDGRRHSMRGDGVRFWVRLGGK